MSRIYKYNLINKEITDELKKIENEGKIIINDIIKYEEKLNHINPFDIDKTNYLNNLINLKRYNIKEISDKYYDIRTSENITDKTDELINFQIIFNKYKLNKNTKLLYDENYITQEYSNILYKLKIYYLNKWNRFIDRFNLNRVEFDNELIIFNKFYNELVNEEIEKNKLSSFNLHEDIKFIYYEETFKKRKYKIEKSIREHYKKYKIDYKLRYQLEAEINYVIDKIKEQEEEFSNITLEELDEFFNK